MNVKSELEGLAEPEYQKFSASLLPGVENILGVRIPKLRVIAKRIAKENWKEFLEDAKDDSFEEILLQGLVIGYAKANPTEIITALDAFLPKIDNWSVCDSTAMTLKAAKDHPAYFGYAQSCIAEGTEFSVRFGLVHIDYITQKRTPKDSFHWYKNVIKTGGKALHEFSK